MSYPKKLIADLESIVGKENVSENIFDRIAYAADAQGPDIAKEKIPVAVVRPGSSAEVSKIMEYANRNILPVIVHGTGSVFKGGTHPKRSGSIILNTSSPIFATRLDSAMVKPPAYAPRPSAGLPEQNHCQPAPAS